MLKVAGIKKTFASTTILRDISFTAAAGTLTVIEGKNGAGKSTLMNILCGILAADEGSIMLDDIELSSIDATTRARMLATLRQDISSGSVGAFSVLENCALALLKNRRARLANATGRQMRDSALQHFANLDLNFGAELYKPLSLFSGGQRQMIAFAMATINKPALLLLDEPTAALDELAATQMMDLVKRFLATWKIPAVMISHDHDLNRAYADAILILRDGILSSDAA
jgi:putative ABC transport system ATP-binding protein